MHNASYAQQQDQALSNSRPMQPHTGSRACRAEPARNTPCLFQRLLPLGKYLCLEALRKADSPAAADLINRQYKEAGCQRH